MALSIRQPWASFILNGNKDVELRTWRTSYRGPLAIHASASLDRDTVRRMAEQFTAEERERLFPLGGFLGAVELLDVRPAIGVPDVAARALCEPAEGDWAWIVGKPRRVAPIPYPGRTGLWPVPAGTL